VKKGHSKKGFVVQCSLEKSGISALVNQASSFLMHGIEEKQQGSLHPGIAPYGETFECAQGTQIVLAIGSDQQFNAFCECMNLQALKTDLKFSNNPARVENRIELKKLIDGHLKGKTAAEWVAKFTLHHIPSGEIKTMAQVFQTDAAHGMILERQLEGQTLKSVRNVAFQIT
jgi:crotonobetainyl-CoA:carnitine CoA-transferase CaiB-like acyl-CoA transferase